MTAAKCGVPGCSISHGLYPETEHELMECSEEQFAEAALVFESLTGRQIKRYDGGLYVVPREMKEDD